MMRSYMRSEIGRDNMGFNKKGWENFASQKNITDNGSKIK